MVCPGLPRSEPASEQQWDVYREPQAEGRREEECLSGGGRPGLPMPEPASEGKSEPASSCWVCTALCHMVTRGRYARCTTPASIPEPLWLREVCCCCGCCRHRARGTETWQVDWNPATLNCKVRKVSLDVGIQKEAGEIV